MAPTATHGEYLHSALYLTQSAQKMPNIFQVTMTEEGSLVIYGGSDI